MIALSVRGSKPDWFPSLQLKREPAAAGDTPAAGLDGVRERRRTIIWIPILCYDDQYIESYIVDRLR
jgi:hypothetical protein